MPLTEGYDIVLEQVKRDGLPENRAIWKYIVTLPPGVYKEVCIDFKGKIEGLTNPANIFGEKATDATGVLEWGGSRTSIDTFGTDPKQVDLTFVCLKAKKDSFFGAQFKLNFIGPSKGAPSGVSLHTNELVRLEEDDTKVGYAWVNHGVKDGQEAPLAFLPVTDKPVPSDQIVVATAEPVSMSLSAAQLTVTNRGLVVPSSISVHLEDEVDLSQILESRIARLSISEILESPLASLLGLTDAQWKTLGKTLNVSTVGELLSNELIDRLTSLRRVIASQRSGG